MAEWLGQAFQGHEVCCHELENYRQPNRSMTKSLTQSTIVRELFSLFSQGW